MIEMPTAPAEPDFEPPSTIVWVLTLLAQHFNRKRNTDVALKYIEEAIHHTPTVIDLYSAKVCSPREICIVPEAPNPFRRQHLRTIVMCGCG